MRRLTSFLLAAVLLLSCTMTAFAAEDDPVEIGVYAKSEYSIDGEYTAPVENGSASVTTPDGTVTVSDAPDNVLTLVVIPMKGDAFTWADGCVDDEAVAAYDIHFLDANGNRINAGGAKVSITVSGTEPTVSSVNKSGEDKLLTSEMAGGKITFTTDGSHYYVITEIGIVETHTITVKDTDGGKIEVSTTTPKTGETVTITVKPDDGKVIDKITVTDESGKTVEITDKGDGTYTFVQSNGDVTVKVTFKSQSSGDLPQTGDTMHLHLWIILLLISGIMLIYIGNKMRKQEVE